MVERTNCPTGYLSLKGSPFRKGVKIRSQTASTNIAETFKEKCNPSLILSKPRTSRGLFTRSGLGKNCS